MVSAKEKDTSIVKRGKRRKSSTMQRQPISLRTGSRTNLLQGSTLPLNQLVTEQRLKYFEEIILRVPGGEHHLNNGKMILSVKVIMVDVARYSGEGF